MFRMFILYISQHVHSTCCQCFLFKILGTLYVSGTMAMLDITWNYLWLIAYKNDLRFAWRVPSYLYCICIISIYDILLTSWGLEGSAMTRNNGVSFFSFFKRKFSSLINFLTLHSLLHQGTDHWNFLAFPSYLIFPCYFAGYAAWVHPHACCRINSFCWQSHQGSSKSKPLLSAGGCFISSADAKRLSEASGINGPFFFSKRASHGC